MKRILFVDDEENILRGLRRSLRVLRKRWDMRFALGGEAALAEFAEESFDVIVSDMKMPGMDGAELMSRIQELYPNTIRIILSGQSEKEAIMRSIGASHQFLSKPCDPEKLQSILETATRLRELYFSDELRTLMTSLKTVPSLPSVYRELQQTLREPDASLERIGEIIAKDVGMTAKLLQIVNSSYFGCLQPITDVPRAACFLGLEVVTALALALGVFREIDSPARGFCADDLVQHSTHVGGLSRKIGLRLTDDKAVHNECFLAGMLHAIGDIILATNLPEAFEAMLGHVAEGEDRDSAYRMACGATRGEVGAYVMGIWGLPDPIIEAIAYCNTPSILPSDHVNTLTCTHIAHAFASENTHFESVLDMDYLERVGVAGRVEELRELCAEVAAKGQEA